MGYYENETFCEREFLRAGLCWHLWTRENSEIIFTDESDFKAGMTIIGLCAKLFPKVVIATFEIMSNHLHFTLFCTEEYLVLFFERLRKMLKTYFLSIGRYYSWDSFIECHRLLESVEDARCVIAYDNRNGFVVSRKYTPFTYPWGANRYFFNPDACQLALSRATEFGGRDRRAFSRARDVDAITGLMKFEGCALPLSFCDISLGERFFHSPVHYFSKISRCVESSAKIAREIGESFFYTDDDLYSALIGVCKDKYGSASPAALAPEAKLEVARMLRYEYKASAKQLQRMLKINVNLLAAAGIK